MRVFGTTGERGCFIAFDLDTSGSEGAVLRMPDTSTIKSLPNREGGGRNYPLVVVGVSFNQSEIAQFLKCFGGRIYTYAFGNDLGDMKVDFVGFLAGGVARQLGSPDQASQYTDSNIVQDFLNSYKQGRLSTSRKMATLSMGGAYLQGLIVGMQSGTASAENNLQSFSMVLKLIDVQGGNLPLGAQPGGNAQAGAGTSPSNPAAAGNESPAVSTYQGGWATITPNESETGTVSAGMPSIGVGV